MKKRRSIAKFSSYWLIVGITLSLGLGSMPIVVAEGVRAETIASANAIDPEATRILQAMSAYLANTQSFSVNADIDFEIIVKDGQKLQLSSYASVIAQRPNQFYIQRQGMVADAAFIFDGETLTLHGKRNNVYAQLNAPGSIDDAIRQVELETGFPAPGADLLFADPYAVLSTGIESSRYLGIAYVNGVPCHHLAFREDQVDWQIWVQVGDQPLPMKYVITSKWQTGAPQYEMRLRDWNTNPQINPGQFSFSAPTGATKLEALPTNELDEFTTTEEAQP